MAVYDAFISYSHAKDKSIAAALQSAVQRLGKPWYRRRALRLFRDDTSLAATPHLWPTIEQALGQSRFLILLASPEAAASRWVDKEIAFWLQHKSPDTVLIGVTDGVLAWDHGVQDFAWSETTPLPPSLKGRFAAEPKWVDLGAYREGADKGGAKFTELAADFAAAIRGMPKEDLLSQEVRQQRRALALATTAAAALLVLAIGAATAGIVAYRAQQEAVAQRNRAEQTLAAATETANSLIFDLAQRFRHTSGVPTALVKDILGRARALQEELARSGQVSPRLHRTQAVALDEIAETLLAQGDTQGALEAAQGAKRIMQDLLATDPGNANWQHDLSIAYNKVGDMLEAQGSFSAALKSYREGLAIAEDLAKANPDNADWQRDLSPWYGRIGNMLVREGKLSEALDTYRAAHALAARLSSAAPNNTLLLRDLSVTYSNVGDVLARQGKLTEALSTFRDGLAIAQRLANVDPGNTLWLRDLSMALSNVGGVLESQGNLSEALESFTEALQLGERLANIDRDNAEWQHGLAMHYEKVGTLLVRQGHRAEALKSFAKEVAIWERLVELHPENDDWQRGLSLAYDRVGEILHARNDLARALTFFQASLSIREELAKAAPADTLLQIALIASLSRIGAVSDPPAARAALERALSLLEPLARDGKLTAAQQKWPEMMRDRLAKLPL